MDSGKTCHHRKWGIGVDWFRVIKKAVVIIDFKGGRVLSPLIRSFFQYILLLWHHLFHQFKILDFTEL
jgi:hypothetical protein